MCPVWAVLRDLTACSLLVVTALASILEEHDGAPGGRGALGQPVPGRKPPLCVLVGMGLLTWKGPEAVLLGGPGPSILNQKVSRQWLLSCSKLQKPLSLPCLQPTLLLSARDRLVHMIFRTEDPERNADRRP